MNRDKIRRLVLQAVADNQEAANDDAVLLAMVWHMQGWDDTRGLYENLKKVSRPESITRRRRELIAEGLIHANERAKARREEAFVNELEMHGTAPGIYTSTVNDTR